MAWAQPQPFSTSLHRARMQDRAGAGSPCVTRNSFRCSPLQRPLLSPCHQSRARGKCAGWKQIRLCLLLLRSLTKPHKPSCRICTPLAHTWCHQQALACTIQPQTLKTTQDSLSHSSPMQVLSLSLSAGFFLSNSCRVGFAKWHKVIINQVRRFVLCFLLYGRGPYGLITSSLRQMYVCKMCKSHV